jgi:hypothetical protein
MLFLSRFFPFVRDSGCLNLALLSTPGPSAIASLSHSLRFDLIQKKERRRRVKGQLVSIIHVGTPNPLVLDHQLHLIPPPPCPRNTCTMPDGASAANRFVRSPTFPIRGIPSPRSNILPTSRFSGEESADLVAELKSCENRDSPCPVVSLRSEPKAVRAAPGQPPQPPRIASVVDASAARPERGERLDGILPVLVLS